MSGFLHRLSAQVLGIDKPVHSATRQPYAGAPMLIETSANATLPSALAPELVPASKFIKEPTTPMGELHRNGAMQSAASRSSAYPTADHQSMNHGPAGAARSRSGFNSPAPLVEISAFEAAGPANTSRLQRRSEADSAEPTDATPTKPWQTPPPLVPPAARFTSAVAPASRASATAATVGPPSAASDATEVHVSIGRIEVTAVQEAPPARRPAKAAKPLMSLDDYLAKRQRGA